MPDINPVVALVWLWMAVVVTYAYQRASREIALESRPHCAAQFKLMADGFARMTAAMIQASEAGEQFFQAIEKSINESLARMTPEQRERYHALVAAGAYKLDALVAVKKNRWPKGTPRKGKKGKR